MRKHIKDYLIRALSGEPLQITCADDKAAQSLREALYRLRKRHPNGHELVVSKIKNQVQIRRVSSSVISVEQL